MACGCKKKPNGIDPPLPQYAIQSESGGSRVTLAARSPCVLNINQRVYKMSGGAQIIAYQPEALKLVESGAPVWIVT